MLNHRGVALHNHFFMVTNITNFSGMVGGELDDVSGGESDRSQEGRYLFELSFEEYCFSFGALSILSFSFQLPLCFNFLASAPSYTEDELVFWNWLGA